MVEETEQFGKAVDRSWKVPLDLAVQQLRIVGKAQPAGSEEKHLALPLLAKAELVPGHFQLAEEAIERRFFLTGFGVVGDRMQSGFKEYAVAKKIGIKPTKANMLFNEENIWGEPGGPDGGSQSGEAAANNQQRDFHRIRRFSAGVPGR